MQIPSLSTLCEEIIVRDYEKYNEHKKKEVLQFLYHELKDAFPQEVLEVPSLFDQCKKILCEKFEDFDEVSQKEISKIMQEIKKIPRRKYRASALIGEQIENMDFITLAFQSAFKNRYQNLVYKIAKVTRNTFVNEGMKCYRERKRGTSNKSYSSIERRCDISNQVCRITDLNDHKELLYKAVELYQNEIVKLIMLRSQIVPNACLRRAVENNSIDLTQFLLEKGATISEPWDEDNYTALHHTCAYNRKEMTSFLLDNSANPDMPWSVINSLKLYPLDSAIMGKINRKILIFLKVDSKDNKALEDNFESKKDVCALIASKSSLETLQHSYNETFKFLPESSPIKLFLKEQIALKLNK